MEATVSYLSVSVSYTATMEKDTLPCATGGAMLQQELDRFCEYYNFHRLHNGLGYDVPAGSYCSVRLRPTFRAVPQLKTMDLPHSPVPDDAPIMDQHFIHRHTAPVPL